MLIHHFKSIEQVFQNFSTLQTKSIDFFGRTREDLIKKPDIAESIVIIIDPTDPNRNLAASISERSYEFTNYKIRKFLANPSPDFFILNPLKPLDQQQLDEVPATAVIEFRQKDEQIHYTEIRDKLYAFSRKLTHFLEKEPSGETRFDSIILEVFLDVPDYAVVLKCRNNHLSDTYLHQGPSENEKKNAIQFKKKYPTAFLKDGIYWVELKRSQTELLEHIQWFFSSTDLYKSLKHVECQHVSRYGVNDVGKKALALLINEILPFIENNQK